MSARSLFITTLGVAALGVTGIVCAVPALAATPGPGSSSAADSAAGDSAALPDGPATLVSSAGPIRLALYVADGHLVSRVTDGDEVEETGSAALGSGPTGGAITSRGYVGGGRSDRTGHAYGELHGAAGPDVTAVTVVDGTHSVRATVVDGQWGAVWRVGSMGDLRDSATLVVTTADHHRHRVTTDAVDSIAAAQRDG
jgi:hypothetical protein